MNSPVKTPDALFTSSTAPSTGRAGRSFQPRIGRLGPTKRQALLELLPRYLIEPCANLDIDAAFGRSAPVILDLGFGMADSTLALAAARTDVNIIAIDVHVGGQAMLAMGLDAGGFSNVRVVACDGHEALQWMIPPDSLTELHLWFPDPWPKLKHGGRRLVAPDFLTLVAARLVVGGVLRMATDWAPYAQQMMSALSEVAALSNPSEAPGWAPRYEGRPITSYEQKGLDAGRTIRDIAVTRI